MIFFFIFFFGSQVMRGVIEEKVSRIIEVIVSTVKPFQLMMGKIIGVGSVGLTQLAVWIFCGALALSFGVPALMASRPDLVDPQAIAQALPNAGLVTLFILLFLGGYFLYAAVYSAVGAMCSTEEEAQQAQFPVVIIPF